MNRRTQTLIATLAITISGASLYAPFVLAAAIPVPSTGPGSGQALEIAPPVLTLSSDPGKTIKTNISLRDISSGNLLVTNQVNDFVAEGEDGTPKILFDNTSDPYSLKSWVNPIPQLTMVPHQIKSLPITIVVPANASPGGHYGVIRFTATPPALHGTGVSLSTSLGALVLINISGDVKEQMSIVQYAAMQNEKVGTLFQNTPVQFLLRLKNEGNTHEQPVGLIEVSDMFGKPVASVNVNLPPRNILPDSIRRFEGSLDKSNMGNRHLFGRYTANLTVTYGAKKQTLTSVISFWVIPYKLIAIVIVVLILGFFAVRFILRRYNRRVIKRYNSRR